jgi:hypothetical protein
MLVWLFKNVICKAENLAHATLELMANQQLVTRMRENIQKEKTTGGYINYTQSS